MDVDIECVAASTSANGGGDALPGTCDAESLFMMGEELRSCMRIDTQCVRENRALLEQLAQPHRLLLLRDERGRVAARATARLLARSDSGAPVVFVDQPLYKGGTAEEALEAEVLAMAQALGERLGGVPVVLWRECVDPTADEAVLRASGAAPILRSCTTHETAASATADLQLVLATTARPRESRIPVYAPREAGADGRTNLLAPARTFSRGESRRPDEPYETRTEGRRAALTRAPSRRGEERNMRML